MGCTPGAWPEAPRCRPPRVVGRARTRTAGSRGKSGRSCWTRGGRGLAGPVGHGDGRSSQRSLDAGRWTCSAVLPRAVVLRWGRCCPRETLGGIWRYHRRRPGMLLKTLRCPEHDPAPDARGAEVGGGVTEEAASAWASGCVRKVHDGAGWWRALWRRSTAGTAPESRGREGPPGAGEEEQGPWRLWAEILARGTRAKEGGKGFRVWVRN